MASWHSQPAYQAQASGLHERHDLIVYPNEANAVHNSFSQSQHQPHRAQPQQVPNSTPQQVSPYQQPTTFTSSTYKFPSRSSAWSDRVAPAQTVTPVSGVLGLPPQQAGSSVLGTGTGYGEKFGVQAGSSWAKPEAGTGSGWANPDTDSASGWSHGGTSGMNQAPNQAPGFVPQKFDGAYSANDTRQLRPSGSMFKPQASVASPGVWRPPLQMLDARSSAQPTQGVGDLGEGGFDALEGGFDSRGGGFDPREREFDRLPLNVNVNAFGGPPRLSPPPRGLMSDSGRPGHHGLGGDFGKFGHHDSLEDPFVLEQRPLLPPLEMTGLGGPMFRRGPPSPEHFPEFGMNPPQPGFRPGHFIDGPPSMPSRGTGFGYRPRGPWVPDVTPIQPQGQKRGWHQTNDLRFQKPSVEPRAKKPMLPHLKQGAAHAASPGWCELCKVDCGRPGDLRMHLKGKQHQKPAAGAKVADQGIQGIIPQGAAEGVTVRPKKGKFPCNRWFDDECKAARKRYKMLIKVGDPTCVAAQELYAEFRKICRRKKRRHFNDLAGGGLPAKILEKIAKKKAAAEAAAQLAAGAAPADVPENDDPGKEPETEAEQHSGDSAPNDISGDISEDDTGKMIETEIQQQEAMDPVE